MCRSRMEEDRQAGTSFFSGALVLLQLQFLQGFLSTKHCCDMRHPCTWGDAHKDSWIHRILFRGNETSFIYVLSKTVIQWDRGDSDAAAPSSLKPAVSSPRWMLSEPQGSALTQLCTLLFHLSTSSFCVQPFITKLYCSFYHRVWQVEKIASTRPRELWGHFWKKSWKPIRKSINREFNCFKEKLNKMKLCNR